MNIKEIYILLELRQPKRYTEILKAMEVYQTSNVTRKMLLNLKTKKMINKSDWYTLTQLGTQTLNDHIDKILSYL